MTTRRVLEVRYFVNGERLNVECCDIASARRFVDERRHDPDTSDLRIVGVTYRTTRRTWTRNGWPLVAEEHGPARTWRWCVDVHPSGADSQPRGRGKVGT